MKAYTDIEQSKKLAEILSLESADMVLLHEEPYETSDSKFDGLHQALCVPFNKYDKSWRQKYKNISYFPCWSLAALLNYLREIDFFPNIEADEHGVTMSVCYYDDEEGELLHPMNDITTEADNFVDACYEMIVKLHEQKIL